MIHELQRRRAGAAFVAVDDDEIRIDSGFQHRLADREKFPGMADAQLEPGRLAAGQPRISPMNAIMSSGVENARCVAGEMQSSPMATPRILEISAETLAAGSTPP